MRGLKASDERADPRAAMRGKARRDPRERLRRLVGEIHHPGALCDIIMFIARAGWWGELIVEDDEATRSLYFDEGHVVGAESTAGAEELGEVLRRTRTLTEDQTLACARHAGEHAASFSDAVVELG